MIPLNLQYKDGQLLVFVLTNKNTNEIYGILDTVDSADNKKFKLSKLGIPTNDLKTQCYKMLAQ